MRPEEGARGKVHVGKGVAHARLESAEERGNLATEGADHDEVGVPGAQCLA